MARQEGFNQLVRDRAQGGGRVVTALCSLSRWCKTRSQHADGSRAVVKYLVVLVAAGMLTSCGGGSSTTPTAASPGPQTTFGAGQYRVNVDIAPGRYFSAPRAGCLFERNGPGGLRIMNEGFTGDFVQFIIDI